VTPNARRRRRTALVVVSLVILAAAGGVAWWRKSHEPQPLTEGALSVKVAPAETGDVKVRLDEVGTIEPIVKVDVKSTLSGKVVDLLVREGETVELGQPLAHVEPDVNQAQDLASVRSAERRTTITVADARREYENAKRLADEGIGSREEMKRREAAWLQAQEDARSAGERVAIAVESGIPLRGDIRPTQRILVTSPMRGVVIARPVEIGETITSGVSSFNAGSVLFTIADLKTMIVKVDVNEVDIGKVRAGQPVGITVDAFPFQRFGGKVTFISPAAKAVEKVKVFPIEVSPDEQRAEFRPGMTANVTIEGETRTGVLTAPTESVFRRDDREVVFVLKPDFAQHVSKEAREGGGRRRGGPSRKVDVSPFWKDLFEMRAVKVGLAAVDRVEVLDGLKAGDKVALDDPARPPAEEE
jgi:HlyD family secretion protein